MSAPTAATTPTPNELPTSWPQKIASYIRITQHKDNRPPIIFPPPSWLLEETQNNGAGASDLPDEPHIPRNISQDNVHTEDAPEPRLLAQRIGTLIDALPPPPSTKDSDVGAVDAKGPPLPISVTGDSKLMKLLSSESVMNGSISLGRQSVWSMLERLKRHPSSNGPKKESEATDDDREDDGVMMYAPLQPTADSQAELADSEMVLEYLDEPTEADKLPPAETSTPGARPPPSPQPDGNKSSDGLKPSKSGRKRRTKEHIHWMPSTNKISLQALWWGYRLYLPPPVMNLLDDTHLEAAKRGAMITAALKWLLDKIPTMMFPPQIRPAVMVLKRLTPVLGYVGVFIAWSWGAIKARDKGDGVVLTATWLLPVALVPTTLRAEDFQRPGAVDAASKDGKPAVTSVDSSAKSVPTPATEPRPKSAEPAPAPKSVEPGLKPVAATKADDSKKSAAEAEAEKESLSRRWSTLVLGREKSKGKVETGK
ncbi:hypothetical protein B0H19DRAFT_1223991 [Mycena capillaripes]|nr:hypothetical protein B0H19DRAFT_1223991 [Mycena capillaripes]